MLFAAGAAFGQGLEPPQGDQPAGLPPPVLTPPRAPDARPGAQPATVPPQPAPDEPMVTLADFSEPVELTALVEYVATTLNVNMIVKGTLSGSVVFNAPVSLPRTRLLTLLDSLLEQQNYAVTFDSLTGFYHVVPQNEVAVSLRGEQPTTRVFTTPNIRPSQLKPVIDAQFGAAAAAPGMPAGAAVTGRQIAYIDELGVIIATESPRRLEKIEALINALRDSWAENRFIRIELQHVAAPVARERALQLVGQQAQPSAQAAAAAAMGQPVPGMTGQPAARAAFDNLGDRLTIDPNGNALIFRGRAEEEAQVRAIVAAIDAPNQLAYRKYFAGTAARRVADLAQKRGLGEVVQIQDARARGQNPWGTFTDPSQITQQQQQPLTGGPVMVVDERAGELIYYATEQMHAQLDSLIREIDPKQEVPVIRTYKLKNARAERVADVIMAIVENRPTVGEAPLLPDGSRAPQPQPTRTRPAITYDMFGNPTISEEGIALAADENFYVVADQANNQLLVKAPGRQQEELAKLISKLDLRRPQVYVEAKIVAVSWSREMRLAFETQLINASGRGGVLNTNFGLGSFGDAGAITDPKRVATGLTGLTAAVVKSDQIPIIMHALARNTDARIVSSPAVLVDDNEEAEIASVDEQPTATTTQTTGNPAQTSFGGYERAGSSLKITPQISEGNYLRLKVEAELSSFTGAATNNLPPPRQTNNIKTESLTVPSNSTVIIGGLNLSNRGRTIVKVPILGDIPLAGLLFRDTNRNNRETTLYVFVTPRILRDPAFADLHLLTEGPQAQAQIPPNLPTPRPAIIEPSDVPDFR
jgi:type II secretory pathway component GspD/PulD (secretin)